MQRIAFACWPVRLFT
ncbi:hypothetical protein YPPY36_1969, partial [Yersinia pestis PY-36]